MIDIKKWRTTVRGDTASEMEIAAVSAAETFFEMEMGLADFVLIDAQVVEIATDGRGGILALRYEGDVRLTEMGVDYVRANT